MPVSDTSVSRTSNTVCVLYAVYLASDKFGRRADSSLILTESCGQLANFPALYTGVIGLKSNPRGLPSGLGFFYGSSLSLQGYGEAVPQIRSLQLSSFAAIESKLLAVSLNKNETTLST
jgi:hypothetical protein